MSDSMKVFDDFMLATGPSMLTLQLGGISASQVSAHAAAYRRVIAVSPEARYNDIVRQRALHPAGYSPLSMDRTCDYCDRTFGRGRRKCQNCGAPA